MSVMTRTHFVPANGKGGQVIEHTWENQSQASNYFQSYIDNTNAVTGMPNFYDVGVYVHGRFTYVVQSFTDNGEVFYTTILERVEQ